MIKPISNKFKGVITISGPIKSGKSQLAEFLISEQESVIYIATSKPRLNDPEWQRRINEHKKRRPKNWKLIEHPSDICEVIKSIGKNDSVLLDSLGGIVEQQLMENNDVWDSFQHKFITCLVKSDLGIIVVVEEIGWGIVPATPIGHLFRERHAKLFSLLSRHSTKKWLAVSGTAIDLDKFGCHIP